MVAEWLSLLLVTTAAIAVHSVTGFGSAQILGPLLLVSQPPAQTVATLLLIGALINVLIVAERPPPGFAWRPLWPLLPGSLLGLPVGVLIVLVADKGAVQVLVGVVVVLAASVQYARRATLVAPREGGPTAPLFVGALSGALTTASGIGAAPVVLWLQQRLALKDYVRYGIAAFSVWVCLVGIALLTAGASEDAVDGVIQALLLVPAVIIGHTVGRRAFESLGVAQYRRAVFVLVLLAGATSIAIGLL